jgi:epoxyqueuosine reductase QueG
VRNALVVAGNLRARSLRPLLERWRADEDPILQEHAAWALEQMEEA